MGSIVCQSTSHFLEWHAVLTLGFFPHASGMFDILLFLFVVALSGLPWLLEVLIVLLTKRPAYLPWQ